MGQTRIRVLDDALVNLIAAGEIVERPASVVKELVENSLDAGAKSVDIEILVGGKRRIVVLDDGIGMSREDAGTSLLRHATSKIGAKEDLKSIHTLGFRGEALPSIASVSRFSLFTRQREGETGTELRVEGGVTKFIRDAGIPPGTRIVVEDLFFSVPARRKFLKSDKTEYFTILDMTVKAALSRPDVRFRLVVDGREAISAPPGTLRQRVGDVLGKRIGRGMGEVQYEDEGVRVTGLIGAPDDSRATQGGIHVFVNDRPVRDFGISSAIVRAYEGLLMHQRFPVAVLFIQVSYDEVDVNIHPTKREVKFADPRKVAGIVFRAVRETLQGMTRVFDGAAQKGPSPRRYDWETPALGIVKEQQEFWAVPPSMGQNRPTGTGGASLLPSEPDASPEFQEGHDMHPERSAPEIEGMRFFGSIIDTYIVMADERGLVLIDQHAAHERVIYERLKAAFGREAVPRQRLLFPISVELAGSERAVVVARLDAINKIGFEISEFGGTTFLVSAIPSVVKDADVEGLVRGVVEELREGTGSRGMEEVVDRMMKAVACHGSVRAGQTLTPIEVEGLIAEIKRTPFAAHCPHGRPTMIRIDGDEIARRFKRI